MIGWNQFDELLVDAAFVFASSATALVFLFKTSLKHAGRGLIFRMGSAQFLSILAVHFVWDHEAGLLSFGVAGLAWMIGSFFLPTRAETEIVRPRS